MTEMEEIASAVRAELCGAGGPWETAVEDVLGERHVVFKHRHRSVRDMLAANVAAYPERDFLVLGGQRLTYRDVGDRVAAVAARLIELGIEPGDRVAILAANSPEWVITFYATVSVGGIVSALNGWWTAAELQNAIELSEPRLIVGDARRLTRADRFPDGVAVIDIDAEPEFFAPTPETVWPSVTVDEDDPALILFTSGTTGRSKGALVSHRGLVGFVDGTVHNAAEKKLTVLRALDIDPKSLPDAPVVSLNTSPLFHVSGLMAGVLMHAHTGGTVVFREGRFDPADVLRLIEQERVTMWTAIGSMGPRVMAHPDMAARDLSSLTRMSTGGAHLGEHMQHQIREHFPQAAPSIGQGYGSSETVAVVTTIGGEEFRANPSATGRACLGFELEIRNGDDEVVPEGVEGELHVRSPYTMLRYWRDPGATAEALKRGRWLATGDVGRVVDGVLYLNSRARDMILRSGENVYPVEIEHRLEAHPDVAEAAVLGVDSAEHGQEVAAVVVANDPARFDPDALASWCAETLAAYKVPTHWERRDEPLPRTATGKVVKAAITGDRAISNYDD